MKLKKKKKCMNIFSLFEYGYNKRIRKVYSPNIAYTFNKRVAKYIT